MLNLIFLYFTKKTRQKTHNSNFKNLFLRIQKELKTREKEYEKKEDEIIKENQNKNQVLNIPSNKKKSPVLLNNYQNHNSKKFANELIVSTITNNFINCNSSISLSTASCEEETLRDEIERLKQEKYDLMNEMTLYKKNLYNNKEIEPEIINIFSYTKNNDLNFDFDPNLFINLDNNHNLYYENDKDKVFKEENLFFPQI